MHGEKLMMKIDKQREVSPPAHPDRKVYFAPKLVMHGELRRLTQGGSSRSGENFINCIFMSGTSSRMC